MTHIVVASPSFSRHPVLRQELLTLFPQAHFHDGEKVLAGQALLEHLGSAEAAIIGTERVDDTLLAVLPQLRFIVKYGVGLDNIDHEACKKRGVGIGWTPGVNARCVAELTLGFMLGLTHNVFHTSTLLRQGNWHKRGGVQLTGKTIGIIGIGHVGREVIRLLAPFDCRILGNDIEDRSDFCREWQVAAADKETIYASADIVSLHVPLTPLTRSLINAQTLALFKPGAFLINTARGPVVEQGALQTALSSGALGGAALDVFDPEPPTDLEFLSNPKLIATPHIGGNADEAILAMGRSAIGHLNRLYGR